MFCSPHFPPRFFPPPPPPSPSPSPPLASQVFYATLTPFLAFYAAFAFALYPLRAVIHPHAACAALAASAPNLAAPLAVVRNWSFSAFYLFAELWGSVVLSVLFWGQVSARRPAPTHAT